MSTTNKPPTPCPALPERYQPLPTPASALLGSGGMADVFRAQDRLLGDEVAIKVVRKEVMEAPEFRPRFEREVAISAGVVHPHLVPLHDLGELPDGRPYLALALADAGSLLELRRTNPPWSLLRRLLDETLSALSCLHARGILHLDVKLSNVLLHRGKEDKLHAWLSDLGLAKALEQRELFQGTLAGTLSYMPLEVLLRRYGEIGPPADLFAVGVLIYRLVSGTNPFKEQGVPAHINLRYRPPRRLPVRRGLVVPPGLEEIVLALVQPDPRSRFDLAADLRAALAALPRLEDDDEDDLPIDPAAQRATCAPTDVLGEEVSSQSWSQDDPVFGDPQEPPHWNRPSLGPVPFRPLPEPGLGARARASLPLFALRELPLVAREKELQRLWDAARGVAATGRPAVVIVEGEVGVGRSRLVRAVARNLEETGHAVPIDVSFSQHGGPGDGYGAAVRRLLRLVGDDPELTRTRLERWIARDTQSLDDEVLLEAELLQRWGVPARGQEPVSPAIAREYIFTHLQRYGWRGLGLLVIEDAQWCQADDDGAELAASVLQLGLPVLCLVTTRINPLDVHPTAQRSLQSLKELGASVLRLEPLPPEAMNDLVEEYLPLEPGLAAEVARRSEGNPLFARELIGQWCRDDALVADYGPLGRIGRPAQGGLRYRLASPRLETIPEDIRSLLSTRLSTLILRARNAAAVGLALDVVGVAGPGLPWSVLSRAAGPGLDDLVEAGMVRHQDRTGVIEHALLAQLLRERVQGQGAIRAHIALAEAWRASGTHPRAQVAVGHHELAAGRPERALAPLGAAVEWLETAGSVGELRAAAAELNRAALAVGTDERPWVLAQLALASADRASGAVPDALERIQALLARELGDAELAIEVVAQYVNTLDYEPRATLGLPALERAEVFLSEASPTARARWHQARAACLLHLGRARPAERELRDALDVVEKDPQRAELLFQLGKAVEPDDLDQALTLLQEASQLGGRVGYVALQSQARSVMARILGMRGQWTRGMTMAEQAERAALAIGFHWQVPLFRNSRAECLRFQGEVAAAAELYREGRGWSAATGQRSWTYVFDLNLALCALLQGRIGALGDRLEAIAQEADPRWEPFAHFVSGLEAALGSASGAGPEILQDLPMSRIGSEGLDGALLLSILLRLARSRGWGAEAGRISALLDQSLAERGLKASLLLPQLEVFEEAMGFASDPSDATKPMTRA
jgi:serine/threonine protein kinase/tetratricopeptide (TPR) repeat protein